MIAGFDPTSLMISDHISDPDFRAMIADWYEQHGLPVDFRWNAAVAAADAAADDAAAAADAAGGADDDAYDADDDAAAADAYDAAAADAAADDAADSFSQLQERIVEPGLFVIRVRGGWYGRGIPYVGWLRPYRGDWWHLIGARRLERRNSDLTPLDKLAATGPTRNHVLQTASGTIEVVHVMSDLMRRYIAAPIWEEHCPRPADWLREGAPGMPLPIRKNDA